MKEEKLQSDLVSVKHKKTYIKPTFNQIRLVAEEAVLALCKYSDGTRGSCLPDRTCLSKRRS